MPASSDLPESIQNLAFRNCVEVTHARWNSDVERLILTLREYVSKDQQMATRSIRMAITGENPSLKAAVHASYEEPGPPKTGRPILRTIGAGVAVAVIAVLGAGSYVYVHHFLKKKEKVAAEQSQSTDVTPSAESENVPSGTSEAPVSSAGTTANQADKYTLTGVWVNPLAKKGKPMRIEIAPEGEMASIHLWTRHHDAPYDLGIKSVALSRAGITVQWDGPFSDAGDKHIGDQTVSMRIYRVGDGLHMVYSDADAGSDEFDFERSE
jgi:hypothetical protein